MGSLITPKTWPLAMPMTAGLAQPGGLGLPDPDLLFDYRWPHGLPDGTTASHTDPATQIDADGVLRLYDPDVPRLSNGWLIEGERTNQIRNPRGEGLTAGVIGSGGAAPTNYFVSSNLGAREVIAGNSDGGFPEFVIDISGTPTGSNIIRPEGTTQIVASQGQTWTFSWYTRLLAGDFTNIDSIALRIIERDSGGSFLTGHSSSAIGITSNRSRHTVTATLTEATTAYINVEMFVQWTSGAVDYRLGLSVPQAEQGGHASSLILPPVASPAASDRSAEVAEIDFGADVLPAVLSIEVEWERSHTDNSNNLRIFELSDSATDGSNRTIVTINSSSGRLQLRAFNSNSQQAIASPATVLAADTRYSARCVLDYDNDALALSLNDAAFITDSGGTFVQPRYMAIGQSVGAANHLNGTLRSLRVWNGDRWGALA